MNKKTFMLYHLKKLLTALLLFVILTIFLHDHSVQGTAIKNNKIMGPPFMIVHGGAGDIPENRHSGKNKGTKLACRIGYNVLEKYGSAVDAVEAAVRSMELDEHFNAGYGSVLNIDGVIQMEASIMDGNNLNSGCCTLVEDILHPISLARLVMDRTKHVCLGADGAMQFAKAQGMEIMEPPGQLVTEYARQALEDYKEDQRLGRDTINAKTEIGHRTNVKDFGEIGTVGAVAIDKYGNIAVATSTGGMTGKLVGRIGDTPILGSGTYADNLMGGVSTTGHGETILKYNLAQRILNRMKYDKVDAQTATEEALKDMTQRLNQTAGAITVSPSGEFGFYWTSKKMAWAYQDNLKEIHFGILEGEDYIEDL